MAWWGSRDPKDDGPPELKDLTPEQIAQAVRKSAELESKLTAQETELATAKQQLSEFDSVKQRLAQLEANPTLKPAAPAADDNRLVSFLEDEDKAFAQRVQPLVGAVYTMGAAAAKQSFELSLTGIDKQMFAKYGPEVQTRMDAVDAATRANAAAWKQAWNMVKGEHLEEIAKAAQDRTDFFAETSQGSVGGGPARTLLPDDKLTESEAAIAKRFGLEPEAYLAQRKGMEIYHG